MKEEQSASTDLLPCMGGCPWYLLQLRPSIAAISGFGDAGILISLRFLEVPLSSISC